MLCVCVKEFAFELVWLCARVYAYLDVHALIKLVPSTSLLCISAHLLSIAASLDCGVYPPKQQRRSAEWHFQRCHLRHQNSPSALESITLVYMCTYTHCHVMNKILFLSDKNALTHKHAHRHAQTSTVSPRRSPSIFIWVNKWCAWQWVNACAPSLRAQMAAQSFALPCFV